MFLRTVLEGRTQEEELLEGGQADVSTSEQPEGGEMGPD